MPDIKQTVAAPSERRKWLVAVVYGLLCLTLCLSYLSIIGVSLATLQAWSFISAAVASLLFAAALSIGSVSYYTGLVVVRDGYQKQIGILGFYVACCYCVSLLWLYPETYLYGLPDHLFSADVLLGTAAMSIFAAMVVINTKLVASWVPFSIIRFVLGLGYVAYALLVMRAILIEWDLWAAWFVAFNTYPPGRLILSLIALLVLLLRISIPLHKAYLKKI